jgi:hypothetical protein
MRRVVQVTHRAATTTRTTLLGQPLASSKVSRRGISQIAHVDVIYSVSWPLNIVITDTHLRRYRKLLPVFMQVCRGHGRAAMALRAERQAQCPMFCSSFICSLVQM